MVAVCAKIESELAELDEADRLEMLESLGLAEPALATLARAAYRLLGLHSYFTAGPKEIRAWTIPIGATRPQGRRRDPHRFRTRLHPRGSLRRGRFAQHKSEAAIKAAGKMRVEGQGLRGAGWGCVSLFV